MYNSNSPVNVFAPFGLYFFVQGGLKAKRLSQLVASLEGSSVRKGLGEAHRLVRLRDLMLGGNRGVAVAFKVTRAARSLLGYFKGRVIPR